MVEVFFLDIHSTAENQNIISKITQLMEAADFKSCISSGDLTAVKLHFGEYGNDGFIRPVYIRQVVANVRDYGGKPFLVDTNTLYKGKRMNAADHLETAMAHGFSYATTNAPIIIADGLKGNNRTDVRIGQKHFKNVKIATDIVDANAMIVASHFKGHIMAGFGGAIKNLAMGCAPPLGKREQHDVRPEADEETCIGCGKCAEHCPGDAIIIKNGKAEVDPEDCVGCGECMVVCPVGAMGLDWETEIVDFTERMTEYALGALKHKEEKVGFLNFVLNVTPDCDCLKWSNQPIVPDIGILASKDPVALDAACLDLVNHQKGLHGTELKKNYAPGEDKFKGVNDYTRGEIQLEYGQEIGLGAMDYELVELAVEEE